MLWRTTPCPPRSALGVTFAALLTLAGSLCIGPKVARAHGPATTPPAPARDVQRAETLTADLTTASARLATATPAEQRGLEQALLTTAVLRRQALLRVMETDPATALRVALPSSVLAALPPQARAYVEEEAELEGTLEILHEDWPEGGRYRYGLQTASVRYSLHFATEAPTHLVTGARIRVRGVRLDTMLALAGGGNSVKTVSAASAPSALGEQRTLVMLVNFSDNTAQPWTRETVQQAIFGTLDAFITENSYGAAWVTGDVTPWLMIPLSASVCDTATLASQAEQAAQAGGWTVASYSRLMYAFPRNACGFGGGSFIGGSPSRAWLNGDVSLGIAAHEFGHGLGLWHSHLLDCGPTAVVGSGCASVEYGDILDMMGASASAHFNAFQKERLGWLSSTNTPSITTVAADGTYALQAFETAGPGPRALKVLRSTDASTGRRTWYYVETRRALGFDGFLSSTDPSVVNGVLIHLGTESNGNTSLLLDMTPATPTYYWWFDPALVAGQRFDDPDTGVSLTTEWTTAGEAAVTVRLNAGGAPSAGVPAVTISTDRPRYTRNQAVTLTATVTAGGTPLAGASVTFTIVKSNGVVVTGAASTGSNGAAVHKVRLEKQDPVGIYQAGAVAAQGTQSGSGTTKFTVR